MENRIATLLMSRLPSEVEVRVCHLRFLRKEKTLFCGVLNSPFSMWIWQWVKMTSDNDIFGHMSNFNLLLKKVVCSSLRVGYVGFFWVSQWLIVLNYPSCLLQGPVNAGVCECLRQEKVSKWSRAFLLSEISEHSTLLWCIWLCTCAPISLATTPHNLKMK